VTLTYSCIIWTHFVEQMDKIIESLNYSSRSYWGDPNKFQFYSDISSFEDSTTLNVGEDRLVRTNFTLTLNGWLIPDSLNKYLSAVNRQIGVSQVVFGLEVESTSERFVASTKSSTERKLTNVITTDSQNIVVNQTSNVSAETLTYLNTNKQVTGTFVNATTATFANGWLTAPAGLTTDQNSFTFFCNGQLVEKTAVVSFTESGGVSTLVINASALGFSFSSTDEIIAIGKFS